MPNLPQVITPLPTFVGRYSIVFHGVILMTIVLLIIVMGFSVFGMTTWPDMMVTSNG
jgi:hypothetical protein